MTSARETALRPSFLDAGLASKRSGSGLNGCAHQTQFLSPLPLCVFPPASGSPRLRRPEPSCHEPARAASTMRGNQHVESPMTMTTERRNFLKAVSAAAASTPVLAGTPALAQGNLRAAAKAMPYQAKPMPFDPKPSRASRKRCSLATMRTTMRRGEAPQCDWHPTGRA